MAVLRWRCRSLSHVTHPPDRIVPIFAEEQAAVFRHRDSHRPTPNVTIRRDESGYKIFVIAARFAGSFVDRDANDLITGAPGAVP